MPPIELNIRFPKPTQVSVHFDGDDSDPLDFQTPIGPEDYADIAWYLETYATRYITDIDIDRADNIAKRLKTLGENLFLSVFADATAKRLFDRFQDTDEKRLITLYAQHPAVLSLPWELLRPPKQTYLMHEKLSIRRRYLGAGGGRTAYKVSSKDRLRVLFVVSRPSDANFINPRSDALAVMHAIKTTQANIELEFLRPATLDKLINRLENDRLPPIDILHFDGHGAFFNAAAEPTTGKRADNPLSKQAQPESNNGYLLFETADGNNDFVSAETLADALYRKKIALVVLSACQSAAMGDDALTSVAARLTHAGLPSVLAMSYSVLVPTTEHLFGEFYNALMQGQTMGAALDTARRYLYRYPERGERQCGDQRITLNLQDWFVPVLYQASQDCTLLNPQIPSAHASPPAINNLPKLQEAGFFGRSQELWIIERAFVQNVRSLAIVGFGGQGKTTLAIVAGDWLQQTGLFARVCFVDYAAFQGVDAVAMAVSTLATVLQESLLDADVATRALQQTATLVILDNVEALTPQVSAALLTAAAAWAKAGNSRVLITTRQDDLAHPAYPTAHTSQHLYLRLQRLGPEDALAYFQRLHKLPPAPLHQPPERAALLALFNRVDFHPLSISLLAGALKVTRLANLGPRLEHYLAENPGNPLLGSLKLSLDRLPADVRLLVPRLGVFQGGAMEPMLLKVTEINADDWAVLRPALAYTGLLQAEALADYSVPYLKFHPTLAPALWQELTDSEQAGLLARYRHSYYQLSSALYNEDYKNPHAVRALALRELPNCLHGVYAALQAGEAFAVEFANNVINFLNNFGLQADKAALNQAALAASGDIGTGAWYLAQSNQGQALYDAGHYAPAANIFETLRLQLGQTPSYQLCTTLGHLGRCFNQLGNTAAAISCDQQALAVAQQLETSGFTQQLISTLHTDLASAFMDDGDYAQAQTQYGLSLAIAREIGDTRGVAMTQGQLGTLALCQGDLATAEQRYKTALSHFSDLHEPQSEATAWHQLGLVYQTAKSWPAAEHAYREAARLKEALGDMLGAASTWNNLALVTEALGQTDAAEQWYRKAISVQQQGNPKDLAMSLNNLANLLQNQDGRLQEARVLAEQALAIRKALDAASAEIWTTYNILAQIAEKQYASALASQYRQCARDSYLGFAGMPTQMQPNVWLISAVHQAVLTYTVGAALAAFLQDSHQSNPHVVTAIEQLLNGERNPAVLLEPLGYWDAAIIHLILTAIAQPDSL
ncbi:MAG: tetratricopeptide repeat protein [Methylococcales bacterium]|nr:tetratricopeptide repeat protein [Methylococcales bacterium]